MNIFSASIFLFLLHATQMSYKPVRPLDEKEYIKIKDRITSPNLKLFISKGRARLIKYSTEEKESILKTSFIKKDWNFATELIKVGINLNEDITKYLEDNFGVSVAVKFCEIENEARKKEKEIRKKCVRDCCIGTAATAGGSLVATGIIAACNIL